VTVDVAAARERKRLLIVGCGRSGTMYTARLLNSFGLDIGHERIGPDGAIGWALAGSVPFRNHRGEMPDPRAYEWGTILHQVRNPLDAIASMMTHHRRVFEYMERELALEPLGPRLRRAARAWLAWNRHCEQLAAWTYPIEEIRPDSWHTDKLAAKVGVKVPRTWLDLPQTLNHREHRAITWADLGRWPILAFGIVEAARDYGYRVEQEEVLGWHKTD